MTGLRNMREDVIRHLHDDAGLDYFSAGEEANKIIRECLDIQWGMKPGEARTYTVRGTGYSFTLRRRA